MVRGEAILFILVVFIQLNTGSVFDEFSTPEKKDKNKMLMYLRGLLKTSSTTTPKVTTAKLEQVWDSKSLDKSDKSKMLAYLRGLKAPNSMFSVYEDPQHRGLIQTLQSQKHEDAITIAQNTENNQDDKNTVIESGDKNTEQQVLWANPATQITILQPAEKESESDTCFWRGQQADEDDQEFQLVQNRNSSKKKPHKTKPSKMKEKEGNGTTGFNFEQMGESVIAFWECMKVKFWKSYYRLQNKLCAVF